LAADCDRSLAVGMRMVAAFLTRAFAGGARPYWDNLTDTYPASDWSYGFFAPFDVGLSSWFSGSVGLQLVTVFGSAPRRL